MRMKNRSMTAQLCCHYASILVNDFEYNDSVNHTQQYLLIHGISLYNVRSECSYHHRTFYLFALIIHILNIIIVIFFLIYTRNWVTLTLHIVIRRIQ